MISTLVYIFYEEIHDWLIFWFQRFPKSFLRKFLDFVLNLDHDLGLKANLRNFFKPLYGERQIVGYIVSLVYRIFKIIFSFIIIFILSFFWLVFLIVWLLLPFYLIFIILTGNAIFI